MSNGDVILIDMSKDGFDDNAIYVLRLNGTLLVKRVKRNFDGSVLVSSDNAGLHRNYTFNKKWVTAQSHNPLFLLASPRRFETCRPTYSGDNLVTI